MLLLSAVVLASCQSNKKEVIQDSTENPLLAEWNTSFGVPPFDKIKNEHYKPAYIAALEENKAEIATIVSNKEVPTFDNTIVAYEQRGEALNKVERVFSAVNSANTNDEIDAIASEMAPILSAHYDDIKLNKELFKRIESVYNNTDKTTLTEEQLKLLEDTYKDFVRSGVSLEGAEEERLRAINCLLYTSPSPRD